MASIISIHKMPDDILFLIFSHSVDVPSSTEAFHAATLISHVCMRWRMLAIRSPRLWRRIDCYMHKGEKLVQEFWERTTSRVKSVPAVVSICGVDVSQPTLLKKCRLDRIRNLRTLSIEFNEISAIQQVINGNFAAPKQPLENLQLYSSPCEESYWWNFNDLLGQFNGVTEVSLYGTGGVRFMKSEAYEEVRRVILMELSEDVDLEAFGWTFPQLKELALSRMTFERLQGRPPVRLENVQILHLDRINTDRLLPAIRCPKLGVLIIDQVDTTSSIPERIGEIIRFLALHRSITTLSLQIFNGTELLATNAPQLTTLIIGSMNSSFWTQPPDSIPYFPALQVLIVGEVDPTFSVDQFVHFVRARCLPASHSQSKLSTPKPIQLAAIAAMKEDVVEDKGWFGCLLRKQSKTSFRLDEGRSSVMVSMEWVDARLT